VTPPSATIQRALKRFSQEALELVLEHDRLVYVSDHLLGPIFRGLQFELMSRADQAGKSQSLLVCERDLPWCLANPHHRQFDCTRCLSNVKQIERRLVSSLRIVRIKDQLLRGREGVQDFLDRAHECRSIADVEALKFRDTSLGPGIAAGLAITMQDRPQNLDAHGQLLLSIAESAVMSYLSMKDYLVEEGSKLVLLANGRTPNSWGAHLAARESGAPFAIYEWIPANRGMRVEFNRLVHSVEGAFDRGVFFGELCRTNEEARNFAEDFYHSNRFDRSAGRQFTNVTSSKNVFLADQIDGKMPDGFSGDKRNIAIFSSSEWEFAGLPGWENALGSSQADIIMKLLELGTLPDDFHLWLRIHPALAGSRSLELENLLRLKHRQLSVIGPTFGIDSYALMESCEKVITFGSTVGIEAIYWGKPSILCGRTPYESLGACVRPSTIDDLLFAITSDPVEPDRAKAIPYGLMAREEGIPLIHVGFSHSVMPTVDNRLLAERGFLRALFGAKRRTIKIYRRVRVKVALVVRRWM
jgi:hypothetical protein